MKSSNLFKHFVVLLLLVVGLHVSGLAQRGYRHGGYGYPGRGYYPAPYRPYYGQTVISIGGPIIPFGGISYRFSGGYFYRPYGSYFQIVAPPIGISIGALPFGYYPFAFGPSMFYYYNGTYYRQDRDKYKVVDAPMGAEVPSLPKGAKTVVINDETFYELGGTYYKAFTKTEDNKTWYKVVGKNGVVNNSAEPPAQQAQPAAPQIGDKYDQLPEGCKAVNIKGQQYYISPEGIYLQPIKENGKTLYQIVGIDGNNNNNNNATPQPQGTGSVEG